MLNEQTESLFFVSSRYFDRLSYNAIKTFQFSINGINNLGWSEFQRILWYIKKLYSIM